MDRWERLEQRLGEPISKMLESMGPRESRMYNLSRVDQFEWSWVFSSETYVGPFWQKRAGRLFSLTSEGLAVAKNS